MDTVELLLEALTCLAQAKVPSDVTEAIMGARLTALALPDGGVWGIATESSLRRLVARILARQFTQEFERECAPFQYALIVWVISSLLQLMPTQSDDSKYRRRRRSRPRAEVGHV